MFRPIPLTEENFLDLLAERRNPNIKGWVNFIHKDRINSIDKIERFFIKCFICDTIIKCYSMDEVDVESSYHGWSHLRESNLKVFL